MRLTTLLLILAWTLGRFSPAGELPPPQVCTSEGFKVAKGGKGKEKYTVYSCKHSCPDYRQCQVCDGLCSVKMVVAGIGVTVRYNDISSANTLFMILGGGGIQKINPKRLAPFREAGLKVADIYFEAGLQDGGWFSPSSQESSNFFEVTKRPAAVIKWVHDNLSESGKFATSGCSGGSEATFAAVYWHGLDPIIDYQWLSGGPPAFDLGEWCRHLNTLPLQRQIDKDTAVFDNLHNTGSACSNGIPDAKFRESSIGYRPGQTTFSHRIDFGFSTGTASDLYLGGSQILGTPAIVQSEKRIFFVEGTHCAGTQTIEYRTVCEEMGLSDCARLVERALAEKTTE